MSQLAPCVYGWTSAHHPEASASLFPKATYLSRSSSQKYSYCVLDSLRKNTKRNPVIFVYTSPMQTKTTATPLAAVQLIGALQTQRLSVLGENE